MSYIYYITYDYNDKSETIESTLTSMMDAWFSFFDNQWLIKTSMSSKQLYNLIQNEEEPFSLLILRIRIDEYWGWLPQNAWDWLDKNK